MDKKQSQKTFVKQELAKHGFITRNKCLRNYVSRLSAIIFDLKDEGFEFETKFVENTTAYGTERDFVYLWKNRKDGKLFDLDSCEEDGLTSGGDYSCPFCKRDEFIEEQIENGRVREEVIAQIKFLDENYNLKNQKND